MAIIKVKYNDKKVFAGDRLIDTNGTSSKKIYIGDKLISEYPINPLLDPCFPTEKKIYAGE